MNVSYSIAPTQRSGRLWEKNDRKQNSPAAKGSLKNKREHFNELTKKGVAA